MRWMQVGHTDVVAENKHNPATTKTTTTPTTIEVGNKRSMETKMPE
jgi:hypothetical protein